MSIAPFQTPPFPGFIPPLPPINEEIQKMIREHVDKRLDEVMDGKDDKFREKFKLYVSEMTSNEHNKEHHHDCSKEKCSELDCLYSKLFDLQKKSHDGKSMIEIEKEFQEDMKDLSHDEKRIFSSLLRADGPLSLSFMLGIHYDEFIKHMKCLGKKIHDYHIKHNK